jgi:macrolide-specific efflux system membrane fusion protein
MRNVLRYALFCALAACGDGQGRGEALDPLLIRPVTKGELLEEVVESGKISPAFDVDIKSKVSGEVTEVRVAEGERVGKGQLLLTLLDTEYQRNVALARTSLDQAKLELVNAKAERRRKAKAYASRAISETEVDAAERAVKLARVRVERTALELQAAEEQLSHTRIFTPMDGVVIRRNVEPGEIVTAGVTATVNGEPQMTIAQMDRLLIQLDLNQVDVARVQPDQIATVRLDAFPDVTLEGKVKEIAAAGKVDATRGIDVFTVKVEIDPTKSKVVVKPGMTAEVRIRIGSYPDVVKVPIEAVFEEDGEKFVTKIVEGRKGATQPIPKPTKVKTGHTGGREIEIVEGLKAGDRIYSKPKTGDEGGQGPRRGR